MDYTLRNQLADRAKYFERMGRTTLLRTKAQAAKANAAAAAAFAMLIKNTSSLRVEGWLAAHPPTYGLA